MPNDQGKPLPGPVAPNWKLPGISNVEMNSANFRPARVRNFESPLAAVKNAVEIIVTLDAPLPIRAMSPVLYVGNSVLTESEPVDAAGKQIRFWSLEPAAIEPDAEIKIGWSGRPTEKSESSFRFQPPK